MQQEAAETVALQALEWLVSDEDLLAVFLGASGQSSDDLELRTQDIDFLGSVLDFVLMDDAWIVRFCDSRELAYDAPLQARAALPGGGEVHWT